MSAPKGKKKKFPIWIVIVAAVMIAGIFITIRINNYLKEKKGKKIETAIEEPEIDADQTRKGYKGMGNESLIDVFNKERGDSSVVKAEKPIEKVKPAAPKKGKEKKVEPVVVVGNALSTSIQEQEKKQVVAKPKVREVQERQNVKFNFTVVKEDVEYRSLEEADTKESKKNKDEIDLSAFVQGKIYGDHTMKHNEPVNLRTTEKLMIAKNQFLPVGALLYGICTLTGNRMKVRITRAMTEKGNFPVDISVYDSYDFQEGIFIEGKNIDVQPETGISDVAEEASVVMPNQLLGTTMKTTSKLVQKDVKNMKRASVKVEDSYIVYLKANNLKTRQ